MDIRKDIDRIDKKLMELYIERIKLTDQVGRIKKERNLPVENRLREKEIVDRYKEIYPNYTREIDSFFQEIFSTSKKRQEEIINKK